MTRFEQESAWGRLLSDGGGANVRGGVRGDSPGVRDPAEPGAMEEHKSVHDAPSGALERRLLAVGHSVRTFAGPIVLLDCLLGFLFMWAGYPITATLPGGVAAAVAVIAVGVFRPSTLKVKWGSLLFLLGMALLVFLVVVSMLNGQPWTQRIGKFALLLLLCSVLATGRINVRSLVIGGCLGAVVNVPLFYAGLTPNNYPPYLTGFYGDKNVAGLYYVVWGILGLLALRGRFTSLAWIVVSFGLLFATGSRTSIAAYLGALAWLAFRNRVGVSYRLIYAALGLVTLTWAVNNLAESKVFGDRTGSDWYREQVELAMQSKADITPWYGLGLNEGQVVIGTRPQWFHDSYVQAFVEGGYPNLWIVTGAFLLLGVGLLDRRLHISRELLVAEGATIAMMVCAWKLGETLMTPAAFLILGIAVAYRLGTPIERDDVWAWQHLEFVDPEQTSPKKHQPSPSRGATL